MGVETSGQGIEGLQTFNLKGDAAWDIVVGRDV